MKKSSVFAVVATLGLMLPSLASAGSMTSWAASDLTVDGWTAHFVSFTGSMSTDVFFTSAVPGYATLSYGDNMTNIGESVLTYILTAPGPVRTTELDSVHVGFQSTVTKEVVGYHTLTSNSGSPDHYDGPGVNSFTVIDTIQLEPGSAVTAVQNTYSTVPEPSTFGLLGLGGIGLAVRAYRRRAAKVVA